MNKKLQNNNKSYFYRFIILFILCFVLAGQSIASSMLQKSMTIKMQNATINAVLEEIQKQSGYSFMYNPQDLKDFPKLSLNETNITVEVLLNKVFSGKDFEYIISNKSISIKKKQVNKGTSKTIQKVVVKGKITDEKMAPIVGATIIIAGTSDGTISDTNGEFMVNAPLNGILEFSFMGMSDVKHTVQSAENNLIIKMISDNIAVDDVIVVGYQSVRRERMTGSTTTVTAKDIEGRGLNSINEVLSSTVSGLNMITSGRPGADSQIQIRGINSLKGSSEPMWIVDGMPMQGEIPNIKVGSTDLQSTIFTSGIGNIAPDDIKSITVLKDAAATAIYGARAANGVIVVETKTGLIGKTRFNFSVNFGIKERPVNNIEMMNTSQKIQFEREIHQDEIAYLENPGRVTRLLKRVDLGVIKRAEAEAEISRLSLINTDWFKEIFRTSVNQQYNFSMSGGTEQTQYYTSLNYLNDVGAEPNNDYNKLGMNVKITHSPTSKIRITGSLSSTLKNDNVSASIISPLSYAMYANPYERAYNDDGSYASDDTYIASPSRISTGLDWPDFNIIHDLKNNTNSNRYIDTDISMKFEWEFMKGFMFSSHGIYNVNSNHNRIVEGADTYTNFKNNWFDFFGGYLGELDRELVKGSLREATAYSNAYTLKNTLQYSTEINNTHFINVFVGQEIYDRKSHSSYNYSPIYDEVHNIIGFPDMAGIDGSRINFTKLGNTGKSQEKLSSFFANASYSFKDRYIVTAAVRYDGSDIIGNDNQFTPLWNTALRWNLHKEKFMQSMGFINLLSVRAGFGYTGSIDKNAFPFLTYTLGQSITYDGQDVPTSFNFPNPNVKWQTKQDMNIGFDMSLFDYRIELSVNYYDNLTKDVLDDKRLPVSSGRLEATQNIANIVNKGVEVDLGLTVIKRKDFQWFLKLNYAYNENKVKDTFYKNISDLPNKVTPSSSNNFVENYSVGSWFGYKFAGVNPMTGGEMVYCGDGAATYDISTANGVVPNSMIYYLGKKHPPHVGGFSTSVNWKQFVFSANFEFKAGHKIRSFNTFSTLTAQNRHVNDLNRWRQIGDITNIPRLSQSARTFQYYMYDNTLEDGDYFKCGYMSVGYNLPPRLLKKINFSTARLSFTAKDLFTMSNYRGIDPLLMGEFGYPNSRKYTITLNIGF